MCGISGGGSGSGSSGGGGGGGGMVVVVAVVVVMVVVVVVYAVIELVQCHACFWVCISLADLHCYPRGLLLV